MPFAIMKYVRQAAYDLVHKFCWKEIKSLFQTTLYYDKF